MAENTFEKLKGLIVERLGVNEEDVKLEASFTNDLGADSLEIVEFIMELEDVFGIEVPDEDAENLRTVQNVLDYLNTKLS